MVGQNDSLCLGVWADDYAGAVCFCVSEAEVLGRHVGGYMDGLNGCIRWMDEM